MQVLCLSDVEPSPVLPGLELLHFLTANTARVFTREKLLDEVWGGDYFGGVRTVDVHVRQLRAKLGEHEALISTVRGVGCGFDRANLNASLSTELNIEETQ